MARGNTKSRETQKVWEKAPAPIEGGSGVTPEKLAQTLTLYKRAYAFARRAGFFFTLAGLSTTLRIWSEPPYSDLAWPPWWPLLYTLSGFCFCIAIMSFIGTELRRLLR